MNTEAGRSFQEAGADWITETPETLLELLKEL